ncbi:toxin co-regulated pilus biosynthesis protein Q [Vibrio sp. N418]|uniref:TcpQ domain-containing protein n=1 Tax=Vibrio sp. (strain N418) TaxID=701176 RepID=UPI00021BDF22|nr:TcpQ domain-containing protein [Vibrio sp. N418]EGU34486.1 toxin co-regulated pilus biosynthesis protein Q [Vibrio sp. N418]
MRLALLLISVFLTGCGSLNSNSTSIEQDESTLLYPDTNGEEILASEENVNWFEEGFVEEELAADVELLKNENELVSFDSTMNGLKLTDVEVINQIKVNFESGDSLKERLYEFLSENGYTLIWKTDKNVIFDSQVIYSGAGTLDVIKSLANDLNLMGLDLHVNVYKKNSVVLIYSVRG